jgi:hypothetical protein
MPILGVAEKCGHAVSTSSGIYTPQKRGYFSTAKALYYSFNL